MEIQPEITRDIYGMPAFVTLYVSDLDRTVDWYVNGLGFVSLFTMPGPDGSIALAHLRRWRYQDILVQPGRPGGPEGDLAGGPVSGSADGTERGTIGSADGTERGTIGSADGTERGTIGSTRDWTWSVMADAEELEALADRARAHGGGEVDGPADTPWNTRDLRTVDPDGNVVVFTARRPEGQRDEAFSARVQELFHSQRGE